MTRRQVRHIVAVLLPLPPSVNQAFASRGHSHRTMKTAAYRQWWRRVVDLHGDGARLPVFRDGKYALWIDLPVGMRGDTDNRTKLISDVLRAPGDRASGGREGLAVVRDDADMRDHMIHVCAGLALDECVATVIGMADWPEYVMLRMG